MEYRAHIAWLPMEQRLDWMTEQFLFADIDYRDAFIKLSERIGYTGFYARIMEEEPKCFASRYLLFLCIGGAAYSDPPHSFSR